MGQEVEMTALLKKNYENPEINLYLSQEEDATGRRAVLPVCHPQPRVQVMQSLNFYYFLSG